MRWVGLKCSWLQLSARRAKPWVLPSNEINCSNGTLHCRHYPHGLESSARLVYDFIWFHRFHRFSSFFPCCPMSKQSFSSVQTQMGKSHDLCWSLKHCTQTNLARRKAAQAQAADARRDSARQCECETVRDSARQWTWHRDTWLHLTSLDIQLRQPDI